MRFWNSILFIFLFIGLFNTNAHSQINVKVGYSLSFLQSKVNDEIIEEFNTRNDFLGKDGSFNKWRSAHGLSLGLYYRSRIFGFELSYNNKINKVEARGSDPLTNGRFERDIQYKINSLSAAYELFVSEGLGLGASLDWTTFKMNYEVNNDNNNELLTKQEGLSSNFYVVLNLPGNEIISLAIKPFVQIPWTSWDFKPLDETLNPNGSSITNHKERVLNFGIQFVFYNGRNNYNY